MEAISFKLEVFEGPLDLLLHLISKHKLNINDIPIVMLVNQYLDYINDMSDQNMEVAGEFLEMAAHLVYIKTVSLLPRHEEAEVMKKELQGRLIEYSLCKLAASSLQSRYIGNNITVRKPMKIEFDNTYALVHDPEILLKAYLGINIRKTEEPVKLDSFNTIVRKKIVSVTSKIVFVLRKLYKFGECLTDSLFDGLTDRSERVAVFLAILELTKSGRILLNDDNTLITFNKNYVKGEDNGEKGSADSYD
ncbi:MAG: segregation/condensation protein A [Oscillospiraceae bacterium]|nr:segregation/condensation protein A [Oscillospiraceae bacterium]